MVAPDCLRRGTWDVWDVDTLKERKREPHVSCILLLACTVWLWDGCRSAWSGVEGCFAGRSGGQRIRREVSQTQRSGGRSAKASVPQTVWGVRRGWRMQGLISTIDKALDAERASTRVTAARGRLRTAQGAFQLAGRRWRCDDNHNDSRAVRDGVEVKFRLACARPRPHISVSIPLPCPVPGSAWDSTGLGPQSWSPSRRHPVRMPCEPALWYYVKKGVVGGFGTTSASFQAQLNDKCLKLDRIQVLGMSS